MPAHRVTATGRSVPGYLTGVGLSVLGSQMWFVALGWSAAQLGSSRLAATILVVASVPRVLFLLFGGAVVDRVGALVAVASTQFARLVTVAAGAAVAAVSGPSAALLIAVGVSLSLLDAVNLPAMGAMPPRLVAREDLPRLQALIQTCQRVATVAAGPVTAFLLAFRGGLALAAGAIGVAFAVALLAFARLPRFQEADTPVAATREVPGVGAALRGLSYVARHQVVGPLLLGVAMLNLTAGGVTNLGMVLQSEREGWGATGYGTMIGAFSAGAVAGALLLTRLRPRHPVRAGTLWMAAQSLPIFLLSFCERLPAAVACAAAIGIASGPGSALLLGTIQGEADTRYLGRVMSLVSLVGVGMAPVSIAAFGVVESTTNLTNAIRVCAAAELVVAACLLALRPLRAVEFVKPTRQETAT